MDEGVNVYIIVPVRDADPALAEDYVSRLESKGHKVHYPPRDVWQGCPTGKSICQKHREAMTISDEVHVIWDVESKGSHFDLGMAYALGKPIIPIALVRPDSDGKSYWKAVISTT